MKPQFDREKQFQTITNAARITGVSAYSIRQGVKNHTVPHIKLGVKYMVDVPAFQKQLSTLAAQNSN